MAKERKPPQPVSHSKFKEIQTRKNAVDCAKAIWELRDYHWRDTNPAIDPRDAREKYKRFTDDLFSAIPDFELIRDIAESAKHGGQLGRNTVQVKAIEGTEVPGGTFFESGPPLTASGPFRNMHEVKPECTLRIILKDGSEQPLLEVLERTMKYWRDKLL